MQYLKDEVKSRIISSALKEFHDKGFLDASMRRIAKEANVAIGNVYILKVKRIYLMKS